MATKREQAAQRRRERGAERAAEWRKKMSGKGASFAPYAPAPEPGTVFDPLPVFRDPGMLPALQNWWERRAWRAGCGEGLPAAIRRAAVAQAADAMLTVFLDRDYAREGITASELFRAVATAFGVVRRNRWSAPADTRNVGKGRWFPWNRAQNSRSPSPAAIFHAARGTAEDTAALVGPGCDDEPTGATVPVPGGVRDVPNHGRMVRTERVLREWVETDPATGERRELAEVETGWTMDRGRAHRTRMDFAPCAVDPGRRAPLARFIPTAPPAAGVAPPAGIVNGRRPRQPLPPVTPEQAAFNRAQLAFALAYQPEPTPPAYMVWRARRAAALRAKRAAARA